MSLVKGDFDNINPYILDEETRKKVNTSHYVLGESSCRDLHDRHQKRMEIVQQMADRLGVDYSPNLASPADIIRQQEIKLELAKNYHRYEEIVKPLLELMPPADVIAFLESLKSR